MFSRSISAANVRLLDLLSRTPDKRSHLQTGWRLRCDYGDGGGG